MNEMKIGRSSITIYQPKQYVDGGAIKATIQIFSGDLNAHISGNESEFRSLAAKLIVAADGFQAAFEAAVGQVPA